MFVSILLIIRHRLNMFTWVVVIKYLCPVCNQQMALVQTGPRCNHHIPGEHPKRCLVISMKLTSIVFLLLTN